MSACDLTGALAGDRTWFDASIGIGQILCDPNAGCSFPDNRRARVNFSALHSTRKGSKDAPHTIEMGIAASISASNYGKRRHVAELTFGADLLCPDADLLAFWSIPSPSSERRAKTGISMV